MKPALEISSVQVTISSVQALRGFSLEVAAGSMVSLVGRNGAGKTSLLRVIGGAASPYAGVVNRNGALGYLSQDPKLDGIADDVSGLTHVLSGRGFDEDIVRIEKLRVRLEEDPSDKNVARVWSATRRHLRAANR